MEVHDHTADIEVTQIARRDATFVIHVEARDTPTYTVLSL